MSSPFFVTENDIWTTEKLSNNVYIHSLVVMLDFYYFFLIPPLITAIIRDVLLYDDSRDSMDVSAIFFQNEEVTNYMSAKIEVILIVGSRQGMDGASRGIDKKC